jgi:glycosyltransferase involved in cell wall biosynthesis
MRLGINGFFRNRETTGSGQYVHHLVDGLLRLPVGPECVLFRPGRSERRQNPMDTAGRMQEFFLAPPIPLTENLSKVWFEQISFPRACLDQQINVAHVPYFAPPLRYGRGMVVTIHDLIPLILPAYRGSFLVRLYTRLVAAGARQARAIITDSEASRQDILDLLNVPPAQVHVVYLAASEMFKPVGDAQTLEMTREKYNLPQEYILYLGGFDQRKNVATLILGFARMIENTGAKAHLVIAGRPPTQNSAFFPDPRPTVERAGVQERVSFIGWVPEEDKPALYSEAEMFVFPSLYEGFGLPPLEAMSCGAAVIASDRGSLPEIVGEAGLLVDPLDVDGLAAAMTALAEDKGRRAELAAKGLDRAQRFSWQKTVAETLEVYRSVAASK